MCRGVLQLGGSGSECGEGHLQGCGRRVQRYQEQKQIKHSNPKRSEDGNRRGHLCPFYFTNPILHAAWSDKNTLSFKNNKVEYYFGENTVFCTPSLNFVVNQGEFKSS